GQIAGLSRDTVCVIPTITKDPLLVTKSLTFAGLLALRPPGREEFWRRKPSPISARWRLLRSVHPSQKATPPGSKRDCPSGACIKLGPQNPQQSRGGNFITRLPYRRIASCSRVVRAAGWGSPKTTQSAAAIVTAAARYRS